MIKNYLSLVKFSHTIFALPFALIGFFIGLFYKQYGEIPFAGRPAGLFEEQNFPSIASPQPSPYSSWYWVVW